MSYQLPPVVKLSERLLREIELAVRGFARYHKYTIGTDLRTQAMQVVRVCHRAWRDRRRQAYWTDQLVWAIDELKLSLQLGSQLHAFRNFRQFEALIRIAEELGRQAGGWKRHANSHCLRRRLEQRFPWLSAATRPRRFHHGAEGQRIILRIRHA